MNLQSLYQCIVSILCSKILLSSLKVFWTMVMSSILLVQGTAPLLYLFHNRRRILFPCFPRCIQHCPVQCPMKGWPDQDCTCQQNNTVGWLFGKQATCKLAASTLSPGRWLCRYIPTRVTDQKLLSLKNYIKERLCGWWRVCYPYRCNTFFLRLLLGMNWQAE